ncbi:N-acetylmuramoyl-L-alanine amidase family protein [Oribacterium sp. WCC10]|uniref:N-acetylmuramoyl-L-alanine amidase family protein n=1 Tax=Oribacterium sp. WCC10 TaxID=1855343 RepID=UPI0008F3F49E|nr:hypothetical protein [Oribacterium sp. WCC10]SFG68946.1 Putative cell wall binding repeat-containing protein [Oribacterium sp. WCC10]
MKKQMYKVMAAVLTLSLVSAPFSSVTKAYAAENNSMALQKDIGFQFDGTDWFYMDAFGQKKTGWVTEVDGNRYYLDPVNGKLRTGWLKSDGNWYFLNNLSDGTKGKMITGWQWIDGYCYYFDAAGKMLFGTYTPDGFYVNANGQWSESDGTAHFVSGKGLSTANVLGESRVNLVTSRTSGGGSGGSGSSGSRRRQSSDSSVKDEDKKDNKSYSDQDTKPIKDNGNAGNNADDENASRPETKTEPKDKPNQKSDEKTESDPKTQPETIPSKETEKDSDKKTAKDSDVKVTGFKAMKTLNIPYQGSEDSTLNIVENKLKNSGVTVYLSNGKRTTAVATGWKIEGTAEIGKTLVAKPETLKVADRYKNIQEQFEKLDIEEKINILKGNVQEEISDPVETTEAPNEDPTQEESGTEESTTAYENKHPDDWTITGYVQPEVLELDYIDSDLDSYKQYFPKTVIYKTNDGTDITIDAKWYDGFTRIKEGLVEGGEITVRCDNSFNDFPYEVRRQISFDSFDSVGTPTLTIRFKKKDTVADQKEIKISLDREPAVTGSSYDQYQYAYGDDLTINLENYDGDGSDVEITGAVGFSEKLNALSYDETSGELTLPVKDFMPNGMTENFWLTIKVSGVKKFQARIYISTDRNITFKDKKSGTVIYNGISKKKDFVTTVSFVNVPEEDIKNISFRSGNEDLKDKFSLTKTDEEGVYEFRIPKDYIKSVLGSIGFTIYCEAVFPVSVRIYTMPDPSLYVNRYDGCYAAEDQELGLKNFSFDKASIDDLYVKLIDGENNEKILVKGTDYKIDVAEKKIILISSSILGTDSLDEDMTFTVLVEAKEDEESAKTSIKYKKDRIAKVKIVETIIPNTPVYIKIENLEYGESLDDTEIYAGEEKISGWSVISGYYSEQIVIPYEIIEKYLKDGKADFTIKKPKFKNSDFSIVIPDYSGEDAPVETAYVNEYGTKYELQDEKYPVFSGTGSVYIKVKDKSISNDVLKHAVGVFHKQGEDIKSGVPVYLSEYSGVVESYSSKEKWLNFSLYSYKERLGNKIVKDGDKYPVYTVTVYIPGYKTVDIDIALKPSQSY